MYYIERRFYEKEIILIPENHTVTEFFRGKASQIFDRVTTEDKVVIVNKNSKHHNVIFSYDRYCWLKKWGRYLGEKNGISYRRSS